MNTEFYILFALMIMASIVTLFTSTKKMIEIKRIFPMLPFFTIGCTYGIIPIFALAEVPLGISVNIIINIIAIISLAWLIIIIRRNND